MLYYQKKNLCELIDADRVFLGEGRGETGIGLHLPFKTHIAGGASHEDQAIMITVANTLIEYLLYKRIVRGPEKWDYDAEKAGENYQVCGDNPSSSGITIFDQNYPSGPKFQVYLDKSFGANEISVRWRNQLVGDEFLLPNFMSYIKEALIGGELAGEPTEKK